MGKKEQGYVGVIRDANNEVLGYAMKPEIKKVWEASPDMLDVLQELNECAYYWSQYDVPVGIHDRIKSAIAKAKGGQP
jgi:hypothetical protein